MSKNLSESLVDHLSTNLYYYNNPIDQTQTKWIVLALNNAIQKITVILAIYLNVWRDLYPVNAYRNPIFFVNTD